MTERSTEIPEIDTKDTISGMNNQNLAKVEPKSNKKVKILDHLDNSDEEEETKPQLTQIEMEKQKQKEERKKEREKKKDEDLLKKHNLEIEAKSKPSAKSKCGRWIKFNLKIGEGAYKYVYRGYDSFEGKNIAWCEFKAPHVDTKEKRTAMFKEFEIMLKMNHPHIVRGFDVFHEWTNVENPNNPFEVKGIVFIQELMEEGNVKSVIKKNFVDGQCILNSRLINRWWHQILDSLRYMHNKLQPPIVHRDLKGENCFLCSSSNEEYLSVKVGDFGLATKIKTSGPKTMIGTAGYMAPEIFDEKYNEKVDIYAFGMLMLEMITNKTPYEECDNIMAFAAKSMKGCGPDLIQHVNGKMEKEIIEACIHPNPCFRPSAEELYYHPFFQKYQENDSSWRNEYEKDLSTYFDHTGNKPADPKAVQSQLDKLFFSLQLQMQFLLKVLLGMRWRMILDDLVNEWNRSKPTSDLSDDNSDNGDSVDNIAQIKIFKDFWKKTKKILDTEIANHRNKTCISKNSNVSETKEVFPEIQQNVVQTVKVESSDVSNSQNVITNINPIQINDPLHSNPANTPVGKPTSSDNSGVESGNPVLASHLPEVIQPIEINPGLVQDGQPSPLNYANQNTQAYSLNNQQNQNDLPGQIVYQPYPPAQSVSGNIETSNVTQTQKHQGSVGQSQTQQTQPIILSNYQNLQANSIMNQEPIIQKPSQPNPDYNQAYFISKNDTNPQVDWVKQQISEQNQPILQKINPTHQIAHSKKKNEENLKNNWANETNRIINCYLCVIELKNHENFSINLKIEDNSARDELGNLNSIVFNLTGSFAQKFNLNNPDQLNLTSAQTEILQEFLNNALDSILHDQGRFIQGTWQFLCSLPSIDIPNRTQQSSISQTILQNPNSQSQSSQGIFYPINDSDTNDSPEKYSSCQSNLSQMTDGNSYLRGNQNAQLLNMNANPHMIQNSKIPSQNQSVLPENGVLIAGEDEEIFPESSQSNSPIDHTIILNSQAQQSSQIQSIQQASSSNTQSQQQLNQAAANNILNYHNPIYQYSAIPGNNPNPGADPIAQIHPGQEYYQSQTNSQQSVNMNTKSNEAKGLLPNSYATGLEEVEEIRPIGTNNFDIDNMNGQNETDPNRLIEIKLTISKFHEQLFQTLADRISTNSTSKINYLLNPQANQIQEICESDSATILVLSHGNINTKIFNVPENSMALVDHYGSHRFINCNDQVVTAQDTTTTNNVQETNCLINQLRAVLPTLQKWSNSPTKDPKGQVHMTTTSNTLFDRGNQNPQLDSQQIINALSNSMNNTPYQTHSLRNDANKDVYLSLLNMINNPYSRSVNHTPFSATNDLQTSNFNQLNPSSNNDLIAQLLSQVLTLSNQNQQQNVMNQFMQIQPNATPLNQGLMVNNQPQDGEKLDMNIILQLLSNGYLSGNQNQTQGQQTQAQANQPQPQSTNSQAAITNQAQQQQQQMLNQKSISSQSLTQNHLAELLQKSLNSQNTFATMQSGPQTQPSSQSSQKLSQAPSTTQQTILQPQSNIEMLHNNLFNRFGPNYQLLIQQGLINPAILQNSDFSQTAPQSNQANLVNSNQLTHQNSNDSMAPADVFQNQSQQKYHANMLQETLPLNNPLAQPPSSAPKSNMNTIAQINSNPIQNSSPLNQIQNAPSQNQNEYLNQKSINNDGNYLNWQNNPNTRNLVQMPGMTYFPMQSNDEILNQNMFHRQMIHQNSFNIPNQMMASQNPPHAARQPPHPQMSNNIVPTSNNIHASVGIPNNFQSPLINSTGFNQTTANLLQQQQQQQAQVLFNQQQQHQIQSKHHQGQKNPTQMAQDIDKTPTYESNIQGQAQHPSEQNPSNNIQSQQFISNLTQQQQQYSQNAPTIQNPIPQVQKQPVSQQSYHQQTPVSNSNQVTDTVKAKNVGRFHVQPVSEE